MEKFWDGLDEFCWKSLWMNFCGKVLGSFLEGFLDSLDE